MTPWLWLCGKASESESWCGLHTGSDFESWHPEPGKTSFEIHPWWRLASCLSIYHIQGSIPDAVTEGSVSLRSPIPSQHSSPTPTFRLSTPCPELRQCSDQSRTFNLSDRPTSSPSVLLSPNHHLQVLGFLLYHRYCHDHPIYT